MRDYSSSAIELGGFDLLIATGLVLVAGVISFLLRLRVEKRLAIGTIRTTVQLLLVGYVLRWVFEIDSLLALIPVLLLMIIAATHTAIKRPLTLLPRHGGESVWNPGWIRAHHHDHRNRVNHRRAALV